MEVLPIKNDLAREFYITMSANERWSIKQLRKEIDGMLFERTAIATKPEDLIKQELANLRNGYYVTGFSLQESVLLGIYRSQRYVFGEIAGG